VEKLP